MLDDCLHKLERKRSVPEDREFFSVVDMGREKGHVTQSYNFLSMATGPDTGARGLRRTLNNLPSLGCCVNTVCLEAGSPLVFPS